MGLVEVHDGEEDFDQYVASVLPQFVAFGFRLPLGRPSRLGSCPSFVYDALTRSAPATTRGATKSLAQRSGCSRVVFACAFAGGAPRRCFVFGRAACARPRPLVFVGVIALWLSSCIVLLLDVPYAAI